jgi:hypothetical protein
MTGLSDFQVHRPYVTDTGAAARDRRIRQLRELRACLLLVAASDLDSDGPDLVDMLGLDWWRDRLARLGVR